MIKTHTSFGKSNIYHSHPESKGEAVLVVPGFSETITHSKKLTYSLGNEGFNAFTFSPPRKGGTIEKTDPIKRQSKIILEILDASVSQEQKVIGVAHSLGSAALLKAAQEAPERFSQLVLMQPVGLAGEHSFGSLLRRVGRKTVKNHINAWRRERERERERCIPTRYKRTLCCCKCTRKTSSISN